MTIFNKILTNLRLITKKDKYLQLFLEKLTFYSLLISPS